MPLGAGIGQAAAGAVGAAGGVVSGAVGAAGGVVSGAVGAAGGVVSGIGQAVTGAAGSVAGFGINAVFAASSEWVASGAVWLLTQAGHAMSASTTVDLGTEWFTAHEAVMASLAAVVVVPMLCCAAIQAVYRQSASMLARSFLVHLPLCLLLTGVSVELVQTALRITDSLSSYVMAEAGVDTTNILAPVSAFLAAAPGGGPPGFVVFVGGILVAVGALALWLELVVRAAAVSAAALFLPLTLAALVWPAVAHWCRRLADTLTALILSKLVIATVLSLAVGAVAGGLGVGSANGAGGGFAAVVTGVALLLVATLSPFTLLKLVPAMEAGAAAHVESTRHRLAAATHAPVRARNLALDMARDAAPPGAGAAIAALEATVGSAVRGQPALLGNADAQVVFDQARAGGDAAAAPVTGAGDAGTGREAGEPTSRGHTGHPQSHDVAGTPVRGSDGAPARARDAGVERSVEESPVD